MAVLSLTARLCLTGNQEQVIMARNGNPHSIPADPGFRCNGSRGFLLQSRKEDLPIVQWHAGHDLLNGLSSINLPLRRISWHFI